MEDKRNGVYDEGGYEDGDDVLELQRLLAADARRPVPKHSYEERPWLKVVLFGAVGLLVLTLFCGVCYAIGYQEALTSDEMRELAVERILDVRTENGDVTARYYMPEGGFTFDSDTMMLAELYKSSSLDGTFYIYNNDGEFLEHFRQDHPDALYPSNVWTPDEVVQFYRDSPDSWVYYDSVYLGDEYYVCCTPDYKHCFAVKDDWYSGGDGATTGWLVIDGVYTTVIDEQTADSLEPDELIRQYRAGTWDGGMLRSKDYGTTVYLSYDQTELCYYYEERVYSEKQDPAGLAYKGYKDPWWYNARLAKKYDASDYTDLVCDFGFKSRIRIECYPDLPADFEVARIKATEVPAARTLDVLLDNGHLQRYSRMELLDEWDLSGMTKVSLDSDVMCYAREQSFNLGDEIYYLDDNKLFALKTGGEISLMLDHIDIVTSELYGRSLRGSTLFVLDEGKLCGYDMYDSKAYEIDREVLELKFDEIMAYKKADGYYTLYRTYDDRKPNYATLYLGNKSLDYYAEYRENLWYAEWGHGY